jgi:hypothetical protein
MTVRFKYGGDIALSGSEWAHLSEFRGGQNVTGMPGRVQRALRGSDQTGALKGLGPTDSAVVMATESGGVVRRGPPVVVGRGVVPPAVFDTGEAVGVEATDFVSEPDPDGRGWRVLADGRELPRGDPVHGQRIVRLDWSP